MAKRIRKSVGSKAGLELFEKLWREYRAYSPSAGAIYDALVKREGGKPPVNDHIALRGFTMPGMGIADLAADFLELGYKEDGMYAFPSKNLSANHFIHPELPKVFVSQYFVETAPPSAQQILREILQPFEKTGPLCLAGRPWSLTKKQYDALSEESEYAAWTAAHGFRVNHHTVSVNHLTTFDTCEEVNDFITGEELGLKLNEAGGAVKGTPDDLLQQSSTMADEVPVDFEDAKGVLIPGCYYEFAKRHPIPKSGKIYDGFIPAQADFIFESTDKPPKKRRNTTPRP